MLKLLSIGGAVLSWILSWFGSSTRKDEISLGRAEQQIATHKEDLAIIQKADNAPQRVSEKGWPLTRIPWIAAFSVVLGGCTMGTEVPVSSVPSNQAVCEALENDLPVKYHGATTDAETITNIRKANARYQATCK